MDQEEAEKVALTPAEFAAYFGKSQSWGYRQLYSGKVKALTGYGRILIPASEVERLLEEAGRYLGSDTVVKKVPESSRAQVEGLAPPSEQKGRSWRKSVQKRRSVSGKKSSGKNALKASAIKKLRRSKSG